MIISRLPLLFRAPRAGELVVFAHPERGVMIKRVDRVLEGGTLWVVGSHPDSLDSRHFGAVPREWVLGKVIWHVAQK